jgi:hypothetical protein
MTIGPSNNAPRWPSDCFRFDDDISELDKYAFYSNPKEIELVFDESVANPGGPATVVRES